MKSFYNNLFLLIFTGFVMACGAGHDGSSHLASDSADYEWWEGEREARQAALDAYIKSQSDNYRSFVSTPVGYSGIPMIMFRVFPDVFPDIWNDEELRKIGFRQSEDPNAILPFGLGWGMGSTPLLPLSSPANSSWFSWIPGVSSLPDPQNVRMQVVNFSCAACHNGRVMVDGEEQHIVGAPSTTFDINAYRRKVIQTVTDERYTYENFKAAISKLGIGNIYNDSRYLGNATVDWLAFQLRGDEVLEAIKNTLLLQEEKILGFLGEYSYREAAHLLKGGALGQTDAFGIGAARILPEDLLDLSPEERSGMLSEYLPEQGAMIDYSAVWNQRKKPYAQWDGSITSVFIRNIAPAIGVIGNPLLVNVENTMKTTEFVYDLPAPPYPFSIDSTKLAEGARIFQQACADCHTGNAVLPLDEINTDPARSVGFMAKTRELLLGDIAKVCEQHEGIHPDCELENPDSLLIPRSERPGYLAPILDGLWARAPYLHNGAIPTVYHLLVPQERPSSFYRGNTNYDQEKLGFVWDEATTYSVQFDSQIQGWSNQGHDDIDVFFGGIDFSQDRESLEALLEYLKTL